MYIHIFHIKSDLKCFNVLFTVAQEAEMRLKFKNYSFEFCTIFFFSPGFKTVLDYKLLHAAMNSQRICEFWHSRLKSSQFKSQVDLFGTAMNVKPCW